MVKIFFKKKNCKYNKKTNENMLVKNKLQKKYQYTNTY